MVNIRSYPVAKGGRWILFDSLTPLLVLGVENTVDNAVEAFDEAQDAILGHAKAYAPWADRTGMAREGLETEVYEEAGEIYLELYHTVDYGQWLETIQNGAYAIIMPTLEMYAERVFNEAGAAVMSVEEG
jgi:hypothetical protein